MNHQPKMKFFKKARQASLKSQSDPKLGAVVVKKNEEISFGFNDMKKTHPRATSPFKTLHAEIDALIGKSWDELEGSDVYVYREFKSGQLAMSKPCPSCELALRRAGIRRVFYTTNGGYDALVF